MNCKKDFDKEFERIQEKFGHSDLRCKSDEEYQGYKKGLIVGRHSAFCEISRIFKEKEKNG